MKTELKDILGKHNLDAIIITGMSSHNPSMNYFTGANMFTKAYVVVTKDQDPILFHRSMERDTAAKTGLKCICIDDLPAGEIKGADGAVLKSGEAVTLRKIMSAVGIERGVIAISGRFEFGQFLNVVDSFRKTFPEFEIVGDRGDQALTEARYTKDERELAAIRSMGEIAVGIVGDVEAYLRGCFVKDGKLVTADGTPVRIGAIKKMINLKLSEAGAENPEGTIFSIGRDAGVPHNAGNDDAQIEVGKTIVFDFFPCQSSGYFFDFTRTWYIGTPPAWLQKAYDQVKQVHHAVVEFAKSGLPARELQVKTCDMFEEMGYRTTRQDPKLTNGYVHSVSHGLGLNVHEAPASGLNNPNSPLLRPGTVLTIEPGLYYPDGEVPFGIRLEDTFYIDGAGNARYFVDYPYRLGIDVPEFPIS